MPIGPSSKVLSLMETTFLKPDEENEFQKWARQYGIKDVDHPQSKYDYRGYWKQNQDATHAEGEHFPDTYKQHGHETFSQESQYSRGPWDGGMWLDDTYLQQPRLMSGRKK